MATSKGSADVKRFLASIPAELEAKVLKGAAKAAANVIADEARLRSISQEVTNAIKVRGSSKGGQIVAKVQVIGPGAYLAPWLEYGTKGHFISVDDGQREGRSVGRINRLDKAAQKEGRSGPGDAIHALKINGKYVGTTVWHPGAQPHPFLRVSLDTKEAEAIAAAQSYINARVSRAGIAGSAEPGDDA